MVAGARLEPAASDPNGKRVTTGDFHASSSINHTGPPQGDHKGRPYANNGDHAGSDAKLGVGTLSSLRPVMSIV